MNNSLLGFGLVSILSAAPLALAQAQIPVLGDLLAGGGIVGSELSILGALPGGDVLPANTALGKAGLLTAEMGQILGDPLAQVPTGLDSKLIFGFVPGAEVLYQNPLGIVEFLVAGNSILSESIFILPAIPLVSSGLELDLLGLDAFFGGQLVGLGSITPALSPAEIMPEILTAVTELDI